MIRLRSPGRRSIGASPTDPVRDARSLVVGAWARGDVRTRIALAAAVVVAATLLGAFLFGLWHVLFGAIVRGNWRAGVFGVVLAAIAGILLAAEVATARRLLR